MSPITRRAALSLWLPAAFADTVEPDLPHPLLAEAYKQAARRNVLASVNPAVFPGYFSVCADGRGFGYGNTYPSLDGHQLTDALLWLGQAETARLNFDYVRRFQRTDGSLPIAILPEQAGKIIGPAGYTATVDANGGLYTHWVPANPLAALAAPTYIQNADVIFRHTLDRPWLAARIASVNLAAAQLASLVTPEGAVRGAGYYVERPTRVDRDSVTQPHAVDAFLRAAALNRLLGDTASARRFERLAARIRRHFIERFWLGRQFAEYIHPERGPVSSHGLSDGDWAALAFNCLTPGQQSILWPRLKGEPRFYYGGMPTGIVTEPSTYEAWEFTHPDRQDLAAMGRVWYVEAQARARMGDAAGLLDTLLRVARAGQSTDWYWRERYGPNGGFGASKYCEYPANFIRIVQRFLFGVTLHLDGALTLAPTVTAAFLKDGFGQTLSWAGRTLSYRFHSNRLTGAWSGPAPLRLTVRLNGRRKRLTLSERFDIRLPAPL